MKLIRKLFPSFTSNYGILISIGGLYILSTISMILYKPNLEAAKSIYLSLVIVCLLGLMSDLTLQDIRTEGER